MPLFDRLRRTDVGPRKDGDPLFNFLNRSARPRIEAIRQLLERWFAHFPVSAGVDLRGRFRSPDNRQHLGAFFELYLFTVFRALRFQVEPHPSLASTTRTPDFKVSRSSTVFYLEVTLAAPSDEENAATMRENRVYDTINRLDSPNFFLGVEVEGQPRTDPPGARIRKALAQWLATLDPNDVTQRFDRGGLDALPTKHFTHGEWEIVFSAIPKSPGSRGKQRERSIGVRMFGPAAVDNRTAIVNALEDKAQSYGALDHPYVIGLNTVETLAYHEDDLMDALFGQETITGRRLPNGVWIGHKGPRNRGVSAVLAIDNFLYGDIAQRTPVMWHHPWPRMPLPPGAWPFEQRIPNLKKRQYQTRSARKRVATVLRISRQARRITQT